MSYVQNAVAFYDEMWEHRDRRVDGWFLMSSPLPTIVMCLGYVYIVKVWGPNFMKNRPAYNVRSFLIFYNAVQVIFSAWIFWKVITNR